MVWTFGYRQFQVLPRLGRDAEEPRLELAPAEAGAQGGREGARGEGKGEGEEGQEGGEEGRRARQDRGGQGGGQGQLFPPPPTFLNTNNPFSHSNFFFYSSSTQIAPSCWFNSTGCLHFPNQEFLCCLSLKMLNYYQLVTSMSGWFKEINVFNWAIQTICEIVYDVYHIVLYQLYIGG